MNGTLSAEALSEAFHALAASGLDLSLVGDEWLTLPQATEEAKVSRTRLYEWMREGLPFLDETPRQIRRSALLQFKADREVVMVRGKRVPAPRAVPNPAAEEPTKKRRTRTANAQPAVRASGGTDRAALLALVNNARTAAA